MLRAPKATATFLERARCMVLARWLPDDRPTMALSAVQLAKHEPQGFYPDNSERIRARVILPRISARIIEISTLPGKEEEKRKRGVKHDAKD